MTKLPLLINFLLFQAVWFFCLLLEARSVVFSSIIIVLMFYLSKQKKHDALLVLTMLPLAVIAEAVAVQLGLIAFHSYPIPFWLALLWIALLLCINTSMLFLSKLKLWQVFILSLVFAPASYWAGARFEVLYLTQPILGFWFTYGLLWASVFTVIIFTNAKIKQRIAQWSSWVLVSY